MRYLYCNTQKKYRTVSKQLKYRHIDTSYYKNCVKEKGTGTVIRRKSTVP
jgi:hypothetical protein